MLGTVLASFADGSMLRLDEVGALVADGRFAPVVVAWVEQVIDAGPVAAVQWLRSDAANGVLSVRRGPGTKATLSRDDVSGEVQVEVLERVLQARLARHLEGELTWLFSRTPVACVPGEGDRAYLNDVEADARRLAEAVRAGADDATVSAKRLRVMAQAEDVGLLEESLRAERLYWLRRFALPECARIASAAGELWAYYRSPERTRTVHESAPTRLREGRFALDWVHVAGSSEVIFSPFEVWALGEESLRKDSTFLSFAKGRFFISQGSVLQEFRYRPEEGRLVLYDLKTSRR